mmetsp:Transcript_2065/g.3255  ORF Transcript_2065/g.3255 Transcript_2065/m.3255 type:complete len:137 (+) Transcript_2065:39-449(+)
MKQRLNDIFVRLMLNHRFSVFVVGTLAASIGTGWVSYSIIENRKHVPEEEDPSTESRQLTAEEARLRAMIENAQNSSFEENMSNALQAHERFMLPNHRHDESIPLVKKIDQRSRELLQQDHEKQEKLTRKTTRFWK